MFQWFRKHTKDGLERPDSTPIELPLGLKRPLSLAEQIARFTSNAVIQEELKASGLETFDESNDFNTGDEDSMEPTPYEAEFNGKELLPVQTKFDEQRGGMVEEFPQERKARAKSWFQKREPEAARPNSSDVKSEVSK